MNFSPHSFVSVNEILADVLKITNDSGFKINTRGWYISQVRQALQELSFDTFFDEKNEELIIPNDLRVDMPKGAFNLKQLFLFNGTKCNVGSNTPTVWYKQNYWTGGNGYLARDKCKYTCHCLEGMTVRKRVIMFLDFFICRLI